MPLTTSGRGRIAALAAAGVLALTSCTPGAPGADSEEDLGPLPRNGKFDGTTVRISAIADVYVQGFKKYESQIRDELGIEMEFDVVPPADAYTKDMLEFRSGRTTHDIVLLQPSNLADYSRYLRPLDDLADALDISFSPRDVEPVYADVYTTWKGERYTVPWDGDQHNLFYNRAAFTRTENKSGFEQQYGYELTPPKTWAQYRDVAAYMAAHDWNGDGRRKYGVAEAWQQGGYSAWWWTNKFASYGGTWFDEDLSPLINSDAGVRALQETVDLVDLAPPGALNFGYPELEAALLKQQVPMVIQWSSTGKAAQDPSVSQIAGDVGVTTVPGAELADGTITQRPALPTGWAAGVPSASKKAAAAATLLQWISSPERSLELALDPKTAIDPWRSSSFEDTGAWRGAFPEDPDYGESFIDVQKRTVDSGFPDLQIPGSNEYLLALSSQINSALAGDKSAQEALDDAAAEWEDISDKLGQDRQRDAWGAQRSAMEEVGITYEPSWVE